MIERARKLETKAKVAVALLAATGTAAIAGCGDSSGETSAKAATTEASSTTTPGKTTNNKPNKPKPESNTLTFDDLGGGSSVIRVYKGPGESAHDMHAAGTYEDGQQALALCDTEGRAVHSHPSAGELNRTSDEWFKIRINPGVAAYATAVYVEHPAAELRQLDQC